MPGVTSPSLHLCSTIEEITATGNSQFGVNLINGIVRTNKVSLNGDAGIGVSDGTVTENVAIGNPQYGLSVFGVTYCSNTLDQNPIPVLRPQEGPVSQGNNSCRPSTPAEPGRSGK